MFQCLPRGSGFRIDRWCNILWVTACEGVKGRAKRACGLIHLAKPDPERGYIGECGA